MIHKVGRLWFLTYILLLSSCAKGPVTSDSTMRLAPDIADRLARLPETVIDYDRSLLTPEDQRVVAKLIEAARPVHDIFLRQVSEENPSVRAELVALSRRGAFDPRGLRYFDLMMGRWDRLRHDEPFISPFGPEGAKPAGAGFYPPDMTAAEFERWITEHPGDRESFQSLYTVIRRKGERLVAIPYSEYYRESLLVAAEKLREAAGLTSHASLKNFLLSRADALLSNRYEESDSLWVEMDSPIEVVIGPYEVYEDGLFNAKASFEAFVTVVDKPESEKLKIYIGHLGEMEKSLPIPDRYKNFRRGSKSTIKVVQEIFTAGDARRGVQTAAFNLPNDEKIRQLKGSKNILLKNVMQAKFMQSGEPVARRVLDPSQENLLSFDAYFAHTLFHELSHSLGPGIIQGPDGRMQENRVYLKNLYSTIEEGKADAVGMWVLLHALERKWVRSFDEERLFVTDAGLMFRALRFGIREAHGGAAALQWNWYRENGAIEEAAEGRYKVRPARYREAIRSLARELLLIEATGDYGRADRLLKKYVKWTPEMGLVVSRLGDIPVDISPVFVGAGEKKSSPAS